MNMFDEARALRGTLEMCGITQGEMARRLGVSQSYIANKLRLLNHCENMQKKILDSGISERHARALLRLRDEGVREAALDRVCREKMNVAECEALVDLLYCSLYPGEFHRSLIAIPMLFLCSSDNFFPVLLHPSDTNISNSTHP